MSRAARIELVPMRTAKGVRGLGFHRDTKECARYCRRARATEPHYLRLVAGNGQVLASSELYANKANAKRAVGTWVQAFYDVWTSGRPVLEVDS